MSNYPNMSYCMCSNTLLALRQVLDAVRDEGPQFLREMSRDEFRSFRELFNACEDFLTASEEVELEYEQEERDGQPDEAQEWESFDPDC